MSEARSDVRPDGAVTESGRPRPTRRRVIAGGVLAGAGIAGGTLLATRDRGPAVGTTVRARRVHGTLPVDDPTAGAWGQTGSVLVELERQATTTPMKTRGKGVDHVEVEALHDGTSIAFRLQWDDPERDSDGAGVDVWRDACAVLLARSHADEAQRLMGTADEAASILHWKADWQRDIDEGFQDVEAHFPNAAYGFYPPLVGVDRTARAADYTAADATEWLPALAAGNPLAPATRTSPVEKIRAHGYGTAASLPTQNARGKGEWDDGRWRVVLARPLARTDSDEVHINPGADAGFAVAVWRGDEDDGGSRKSLAKVLLRLEVAP
jgi:DMSO reductase family type II enzyme heme b subunit